MSETNSAVAKTEQRRIGKPKRRRVEEHKVKLTWREVKKQKELIFITIPFVIYGIVFYYLPLFGWIMAFQS